MHAFTGMATTLLTTDDPRKLPHHVGIGPPWEYVAAASQFGARGGKARPIVYSGRVALRGSETNGRRR